MFKKRPPRFRPSILDRLEERTVPSSGVAHAQVSAAAVGSTPTSSSASASRLATLQTELTAAGTQVNAAYATFATSLRQLETTLIQTYATAPTPGPGQAAPTLAVANPIPTTASVAPQVTALVNTLATSVTAAYGGVSNLGGDASVIGQGINGGSVGSLNSQLLSLLNAASVNGAVSQDSLPLLFSAVEGTLSYSYGSTAIQGLLAGLASAGINPTAASSTAGAFSPATFGTQVNAAYSTFATTIRGIEAQVPTGATTPTGTTTGAAATATATTALTTAVNNLGTSVAAALNGTTVAGFASYLPVEQALTLSSFGSLFGVAAPNGVVATGNVALLSAIAENAINSSYNSTSIQGFLLSQFANATGTGIGSTGSGVNAGTGGTGTGSGTGSTTGGTGGTGTGTNTSTGSSTGSGSVPTTVNGGNGTTTPGVGGVTGTTTGTGTGNTGVLGTGTTTGTGGSSTGTSNPDNNNGVTGVGTTGTTGTSGTGTTGGTTTGTTGTTTGGTGTGTSVGTTTTTGSTGTGSGNTTTTATGTNTGGTSTTTGGSTGTTTGGSGSGGIPSVGTS